MVEATRRVARQDPFNTLVVDGSYSPRSSSHSMGLDQNQITIETREIEKFLAFKPKHFRKLCDSWDMRQKLEVDFASDDRHNAGESVVVISCGFDDSQIASIRRFTRQKLSLDLQSVPSDPSPEMQTSTYLSPMFGGAASVYIPDSVPPSPRSTCRSLNSSYHSEAYSSLTAVEWL